MLDYAQFKYNYRIITVNLSKQKALDANPTAIQQIVFQGVFGGVDGTKIRLYTIIEQSNETVRILQSNSKSFVGIYKWLNTTKQTLNYQMHS